jgi:hypothetical protein
MSNPANLTRPEPLGHAQQLAVTRLTHLEHVARRAREAIWRGDRQAELRAVYEIREATTDIVAGVVR